MLSMSVVFTSLVDSPSISSPFVRNIRESHYQIYLPSSDKEIGEITVFQNTMTFMYSSELWLEEFMVIHDVISQITNREQVKVDDSNSFLGYLPNGDSAYMIRNWNPWLEYIQNSMKKCQ